MTFRIERSLSDHTVVFALSGEIGDDCRADLQALIRVEADRRIAVDLSDIALVDRTGVLLLEVCETAGVTLVNCPAYVREWIERECEAGSRRSSKSQETPMVQTLGAAEEGRIE